MMPKTERLEQIKKIILQKNRIEVNQLSEYLNVSKVTIRNDLKELEDEGVLKRTHGGAIVNTSALRSPSLSFDPGHALSDPDSSISRIAAKAQEFTDENEWIFLGSGSTCYAIAKAMAHRHVQIVTNNLFAATYLASFPNINVITCGGKVHSGKFPFLYGDLALNNISSMIFSKAFIGVSGADFKHGYSVSNDVERNIFKSLKECSEKIVIVTDSSKFGNAAFMNLGSLDIANALITDLGIPEAYRSYYESSDIELVLT